MYVCMHACMHACMYVCMYVCMHVCHACTNPVTTHPSWDKCRTTMLHVARRGVEVISDSINNIITPRDGLITPNALCASRHSTRAWERGGI